jgi:hypothetical protein
MRIDLSKKYQTLTGLRVELYKQHDIGVFPIVGAIFNAGSEGYWKPACWALSGNNSANFNWNLEEVVDFKTSYLIEKYSSFVDYFGLALSASVNVKWLATDEDGTVYGYFDEPYLKPCYDNLGFWVADGDSVKLLKIKFAGDWCHSKVQVVTKDD